MHRTILIILATLLLASSASASFAVYIDDNGPPSDVILATDVVLRASAYTDEIPTSGYTALFSEYETPADMMLVISDGDVWIVESSSSARLRTALVRAVSELDIEAEYTTDVPDVLVEWEPADDTDADVEENTDPESDDPEADDPEGDTTDEMNETASEEPMQPTNEQNVSDDDGSQEAQSPEGDPDEPERGFWSRIANVLFGWMRR